MFNWYYLGSQVRQKDKKKKSDKSELTSLMIK